MQRACNPPSTRTCVADRTAKEYGSALPNLRASDKAKYGNEQTKRIPASKMDPGFLHTLSAKQPFRTSQDRTLQGRHGPLSTEAALVLLLAQVDTAVNHSAKLLMGGKRLNRPGSFTEITILTDIEPAAGMRLSPSNLMTRPRVRPSTLRRAQDRPSSGRTEGIGRRLSKCHSPA